MNAILYMAPNYNENYMRRFIIDGGFVKESGVRNVIVLNRLILEVYGENRGK